MKPRVSRKLSFSFLPLLLAGLLACLGCIGATRLSARSHGPEGADIQKQELDLSFLQVGITRRDDVLSRLHSVDSGYSNPHLFWGRWSDSKWGYWVVVVGMGGGGAAGAGRNWHVHNLLVTFDEKGVMQEQKLIDNDRVLWRELHTRLADAPRLDLSQPMAIPLEGSYDYDTPVRLTISKDAIHVKHRKARRSCDISPLNVSRFQHWSTKGASPGTTCHILKLAERTAAGKRVSFCAAPMDVATMFQYLGEYGSTEMAWE